MAVQNEKDSSTNQLVPKPATVDPSCKLLADRAGDNVAARFSVLFITFVVMTTSRSTFTLLPGMVA